MHAGWAAEVAFTEICSARNIEVKRTTKALDFFGDIDRVIMVDDQAISVQIKLHSRVLWYSFFFFSFHLKIGKQKWNN